MLTAGAPGGLNPGRLHLVSRATRAIALLIPIAIGADDPTQWGTLVPMSGKSVPGAGEPRSIP